MGTVGNLAFSFKNVGHVKLHMSKYFTIKFEIITCLSKLTFFLRFDKNKLRITLSFTYAGALRVITRNYVIRNNSVINKVHINSQK